MDRPVWFSKALCFKNAIANPDFEGRKHLEYATHSLEK
jgi:hypothetical protein